MFAILADQADPDRVRRVGRIALTAPTIPEDTHVARMAWLIGARDWPDRRLLITAVDVETGRPVVWDRGSGVPLASAVAASCAMPAAYPPVTIAGRRYMDGALGGGANIHLADGADPGDRSRWRPVHQAGVNQARTAAGVIRRQVGPR
ncbi:patatin-like phospholipase family protein [Parafrankia discariae]|uniref:patatin-like phospholipase family protein n=1 Tax=Parafrankia discariae TaxID=365528 RepID=UPI0003A52A75|nr:patatin-like phospholipase family protein [Parafrankia discariae]